MKGKDPTVFCIICFEIENCHKNELKIKTKNVSNTTDSKEPEIYYNLYLSR